MHRAQLTTPVRLATTTLLAALIVSACGSSSQHKGGQTPYGPKSSPYAMSKCFRANGVSNFPDPSAGPSGSVGFAGVGFGTDGTMVVDGTRFSGPAVRSAEKACSEFLPSGPPPKMSEAQKQKLVAMAQCMRTHGVPNFPDPTFNGSGPTNLNQINANSPAFRNAAKQCGGPNGIEIAIPGP